MTANMAHKSKIEKNREKVIQDRLQVLLTQMLTDEDNKYCVDCDAKGPLWASWNIGIFLCIRCAGIHRNLGVHISKVKSVNLDSWTPKQVASMQVMGNSRARAVYEARVPEEFRRPQSDSALENFIRNKYEKKKFIALEWTPTLPPECPIGWAELKEAEKQKRDIRSSNILLPSRVNGLDSAKTNNVTNGSPKAKKGEDLPPKEQPANPTPSPSIDLLGLISPPPNPVTSTTTASTGDKLSSRIELLHLDGPNEANNSGVDFNDFLNTFSSTVGSQVNESKVVGSVPPSSNNTDLNQLTASFAGSNLATQEKPKAMTKDSIMALFNCTPQAPRIVEGQGMQLPAAPLLRFPSGGASAVMGQGGSNNSSVFQQQYGGLVPSAVGGGSFASFQQTQINQFGMQPAAPPGMSTLNNHFVKGVDGNGGGTMSNMKQSNAAGLSQDHNLLQ